MINLSFVIVPSRPNKDGSHQIRLKISCNRTIRYISTKYQVGTESQFQNGRVVKYPGAILINQALSVLMDDYEQRLSTFNNPKATATEVKAYLEAEYIHTDLVSEFAEYYIKQLKSNGQNSYAQNMEYTLKYLLDCFGKNIAFSEISTATIKLWEKYLNRMGYSATTINIRMSHLKALLNAAVTDGIVEYKVFPFRGYKMPQKNVRDICVSKSELAMLRNAEFSGVSAKRLTVARDLFLLSFYCAGINLIDLMDATFKSNVLTFVRKKTADKKKSAEKEVSITIQPEAWEIINKYVDEHGKLDFGYHYTDYGQFRSFVTKSLNRLGEEMKFEKKLMYYSARKTFVQFGTDLGIPLYILEYAIGQTIKDKSNRPIHDYFKVMRMQADMAIRTIIGYSFDMEDEELPVPEWAKKYVKRK